MTRTFEYEEMLRLSLDRQLSLLGQTRFADHCPALEGRGIDLIKTMDSSDIEPVLVHGDYRLENLRVDATREPVTRAVLDWESPMSGDALWDVAMTLAVLIDQAGFTLDRRRTSRAAFFAGYGDIERGSVRWELYRLLARIRLARHLSYEMQERSAAATERRAREHHMALQERVDGRAIRKRFRKPRNDFAGHIGPVSMRNRCQISLGDTTDS